VILDDVARFGLSRAGLAQVGQTYEQVISEHDHGTGDEFFFEGNGLDGFECRGADHCKLGW